MCPLQRAEVQCPCPVCSVDVLLAFGVPGPVYLHLLLLGPVVAVQLLNLLHLVPDLAGHVVLRLLHLGAELAELHPGLLLLGPGVAVQLSRPSYLGAELAELLPDPLLLGPGVAVQLSSLFHLDPGVAVQLLSGLLQLGAELAEQLLDTPHLGPGVAVQLSGLLHNILGLVVHVELSLLHLGAGLAGQLSDLLHLGPGLTSHGLHLLLFPLVLVLLVPRYSEQLLLVVGFLDHSVHSLQVPAESVLDFQLSKILLGAPSFTWDPFTL